MENKKLLYIAGGLSLLEGALMCISDVFLNFGFIILGLGIFLISLSNKSMEEQLKQKGLLILIIIAGFILNPIVSVMLIAVVDNLSVYKKKRYMV